MVRPAAFNHIPPCSISSPSRLAAFGAFAPLTPLRLAPLAVGAPIPLPRRRRGLRPPPASASHLPRCPHHCGRHYRRLRSLALPPHFLRRRAAMVRASAFNPIPRRYILTLTARRLCPSHTPPPRSARRRRPRPTSASPVRASPASGFRIPPCPGVRTTARATAVASDSVLRTTAVNSFSSDRHSIAVPAPIL